MNGKHCDVYVKKLARICDRPAVVNQDGRSYCSQHDPYALWGSAAADLIEDLQKRMCELRGEVERKLNA